MKNIVTPGEKLEERYRLDTSEDFLTTMKAVSFFGRHIPTSYIRRQNGGAAVTDRDVALQKDGVRIRCGEILNDLGSGLSRLGRGYGGMEFNPEDSDVIDAALDLLANQDSAKLKPEDRVYAPFIGSAQHILGSSALEGFGADMRDAEPKLALPTAVRR